MHGLHCAGPGLVAGQQECCSNVHVVGANPRAAAAPESRCRMKGKKVNSNKGRGRRRAGCAVLFLLICSPPFFLLIHFSLLLELQQGWREESTSRRPPALCHGPGVRRERPQRACQVALHRTWLLQGRGNAGTGLARFREWLGTCPVTARQSGEPW
jgi:hypothetical protein